LIAATDRALEADRGFNQALRRRMEAYVIRLPALRERREDIGLLMSYFLQMYGPEQHNALPAHLISRICNGDWPGNVRQLAHAMRRIALDLCAEHVPALDESTFAQAALPAAATTGISAQSPERTPDRRKLSELSHEEICDAMEQCDWQIQGAAQRLGISRPSLYKLLETHPRIRFPARIPVAEIQAAVRACDGDLLRCASRLMTPAEALRRHLIALGIASS
jgi:two-component system nitrogen regulation response regulator GlnG